MTKTQVIKALLSNTRLQYKLADKWVVFNLIGNPEKQLARYLRDFQDVEFRTIGA